MNLLLQNGKAYQVWSPQREADLESMVAEHADQIFGAESRFFELKAKMVSSGGIAFIPDAYLIAFEDGASRWYIVEIELSSHSIYNHVLPQVTKFKVGFRKPETRRMLVDLLYEEIMNDNLRKEWFKTRLGDVEIHRFLNDTLSREPGLLIVIDSRTPELAEVFNSLPFDTDIVEFQTFAADGSLSDHIHEFEPLYGVASEVRADREGGAAQAVDIIRATFSGKPVRVSRDDVLRAATDPKLADFSYHSYYVDLNGKKLPAKGLLSLATGVPITDFDSPRARRILQKLGFLIRQV